MRKKWLRWVPVILWCILIYSLTASPVATSTYTESAIRSTAAVPTSQVQTINTILRKQAHVVEFAILVLLAKWAIGTRPAGDLLALLFTALYAASDELHQRFVPGRTSSFEDVVLDACGALAALFISRLLVYMLEKQHNNKGASR